MSDEDPKSSDSSTRKRPFDDIISTNQSSSQTDFANKFRRLRACARCHRLKMRCVFEDPSFESCTRCFKAGLKCSATDDPTQSQAKRKPRKRTKLKGDGPLAQLQQGINESNKLFKSIQKNSDSYDYENITTENLLTLQFQLSETQRLLVHTINAQKSKENNEKNKTDPVKHEANSINSMKDGIVKAIPNLPWISHEQNIMKELIKLDIISSENAKARMNYFLHNIYIYWPCVSFPKHYTYDWLIENDPLVLLSFITVTCLNEPDLHDTLLYYLEDNLSIRTSITGNISVSFIQVYLVLSLWCSPPRKWGSYKHQMSLLMALNLTLCLDLGNEVYKNTPDVLNDNSIERQMIRSYMAVYACCGSLGLSLPRFKVVSWTPVHERCCQLLLMGESNDADKFIYYYSKLVALGEEIFQFLCPNGFPNNSVRKNSNSINPNSPVNDSIIDNSMLRTIMVNYEKRMQKLAMESNLFNSGSKIRNLLSIIYYQLLMTMYDYIVCRVLLRRDVLTEVYLQTLSRLIKASQKVIDSFISLCDQTSDFPTFFYYRPMHALVALIRARLLVKTQQLDFDVNVEQAYEKVLTSIKNISKESKVANKMSAILTRISKWMKVSSKFNKNGATNSMVDLLDELGKEKAIENIKIKVSNNTKDSGDNMNMSTNSRIQFNKFINYGIGNMNNDKINNSNSIYDENIENKTEISSKSMTKGQNLVDLNEIENRSNSIFVPSPIGYSHSDIMDIPMNNQNQQNRRNTENIFNANLITPNSEFSKNKIPEGPTEKLASQFNKEIYYSSNYNNKSNNNNNNNRNESEISQIDPNLVAAAQQLNQMMRSKTPSLSEASSGPNTFLIPRSTSITQQDLENIQPMGKLSDIDSTPLSTVNDITNDNNDNNNDNSNNNNVVKNRNNSNSRALQQTDQEFLNGLFSQIDTDIMNTDSSNSLNGLGVAPMFDFLGTFGYQTFSGDLPIPEDWYKSL